MSTNKGGAMLDRAASSRDRAPPHVTAGQHVGAGRGGGGGGRGGPVPAAERRGRRAAAGGDRVPVHELLLQRERGRAGHCGVRGAWGRGAGAGGRKEGAGGGCRRQSGVRARCRGWVFGGVGRTPARGERSPRSRVPTSPLVPQGVTRLLLTRIPFFKEVIVSSFTCGSCAWSNTEIQSAGRIQEQGVRYTLTVTSRQVSAGSTAAPRTPASLPACSRWSSKVFLFCTARAVTLFVGQ